MNQELIRMDKIYKIQDNYTILDHAWFNVRVGETVGLIGMNNAGKTSLMQILTGAARLTHGYIYIEDKAITFYSEAQTRRLGIHYITRRSSLVDCFSIAENFLIMPYKKKFFINRKVILSQVVHLLEEFELNIPLNSKIRDLNDYDRLSIEILRATMQNARVIIIDDVLNHFHSNDNAINKLHKLIQELNRREISLILLDQQAFPSVEICDRIFILRNGITVGEFERKDYDEKILTSVMVGYNLKSKTQLPRIQKPYCSLFQMSNVATKGSLQDLNLKLGKGEIVGICTISDEVKQNFSNLFSGVLKISAGKIWIDGISYTRSQKIRPEKAGIGILSYQNRVFSTMNLYENIMVTANKRLSSKLGLIRKGYSNYTFNELYVKYFYQKIPLGKYSLCNHTNTITDAVINIARVIASRQIKLLVCIDATKYLDTISAQTLISYIQELAFKGMSVLFISSDIHELINICDKIYFFNDRSLVKCVNPITTDAQVIVDQFKGFCLHF